MFRKSKSMSGLYLPVIIIYFLLIKLGELYVSEWEPVFPQGTKLGPWLFFIMIDDLVVKNARLWKYVDDTTISETVAKGELSNAQRTTDRVVQWSLENRIQKCEYP